MADLRRASDAVAGIIPHARFLTMLILMLNGGLYLASVVYGMKAGDSNFMDLGGRTLLQLGAKHTGAIAFGQWWRLVTAGFLHGGLFHILMNSWVLFDLGAQVEELYGAKRMLSIYFVATVAGFFLSSLWSPVLSVGASAGVFGLIGAMIALGVRSRTMVGAAIRGWYIRWAVYGLLMGLLRFFAIDNAAHIGGLVGGFVVAYLARLPGEHKPLVEHFWTAAAAISVALTALSFLRMFLWFLATNS